MKDYKWRTAPYGTEGVNTIYVDSFTGSDILGDGKRNNPYRTIAKALESAPSRIICRGVFTEEVSGPHNGPVLYGDYLGAAIIDGQNSHIIWGFGVNNMIIRNSPVLESPASHLVAGVGRAFSSTTVGDIAFVLGVTGSAVHVVDSGLYMGVIGQTYPLVKQTSVAYIRPRSNSAWRISLGSPGSNFYSNTVYGCRITSRRKCIYDGASYKQTFSLSIFADFDMIANEAAEDTIYDTCVFASDCKWYYLSGINTDSDYREIPITGSTSAERQSSLLSGLESIYDELGVEEASRNRPSFVNCIFSNQSSSELFNDIGHDDFTLRPGCDADVYGLTSVADAHYIGALPPALNIPIKNDSTGLPGTWDEKTVSCCIVVADDAICLDTNNESAAGEIYSKIVKIDPFTTQLNGIYSIFQMLFSSYGVHMGSNNIIGSAVYHVGDTMPIGRYIAMENIYYLDSVINKGDILVITSNDTTFSSDVVGAAVKEIDEPNIIDAVLCRCRTAIYAYVTPQDTLQAGATYYNNGDKDITYHNHTIVSGESFVCMLDGEQFTCASDSNYQIAVMFDDTRVPASDWCPAQLFGEYFVMKQAGAIKKDPNGVALSSGNYNSYNNVVYPKSVMDKVFVQFAIKVTKDDIENY